MKNFDLYEALKSCGFYEVDDEFGSVLRKDFKRVDDVVWYGQMEFNFIIRVCFSDDHSVVQVSYFKGSVPVSAFKVKTHLNEKRALNAIRETAKNNGFEF